MAWCTNGAPQISVTVGFGEHENHDIDLTYREAKALGQWLCRRASDGEKVDPNGARHGNSG
jgi:hypothetical protein